MLIITIINILLADTIMLFKDAINIISIFYIILTNSQ